MADIPAVRPYLAAEINFVELHARLLQMSERRLADEPLRELPPSVLQDLLQFLDEQVAGQTAARRRRRRALRQMVEESLGRR